MPMGHENFEWCENKMFYYRISSLEEILNTSPDKACTSNYLAHQSSTILCSQIIRVSIEVSFSRSRSLEIIFCILAVNT